MLNYIIIMKTMYLIIKIYLNIDLFNICINIKYI
jgi:hypothetical protein